MFTYRPPIHANHLNKAEVACAREQRLKEIQMWSVIREIFIYFCFLSLLYIVTYSKRQSNSFLPVNHLRKYFLNSRQINYNYTEVNCSSNIFRLYKTDCLDFKHR